MATKAHDFFCYSGRFFNSIVFSSSSFWKPLLSTRRVTMPLLSPATTQQAQITSTPKFKRVGCLLAELWAVPLKPVRLQCRSGFRTKHKDRAKRITTWLRDKYNSLLFSGVINADNNFRRRGDYQELHILRYMYI